jgi:hypothetical protein
VGGSGKTLFTFINVGTIQSHIGDINFDWGTGTALDFDSFSFTGEVIFSVGARPRNLPGGKTIAFTADWSTDADCPTGTGKNGIDNFTGSGTQDTLTIAFTGSTFGDIISALDNGTYRIGLHLQGLTDGKSESYVSGGGNHSWPRTGHHAAVWHQPGRPGRTCQKKTQCLGACPRIAKASSCVRRSVFSISMDTVDGKVFFVDN